MKGWTEQDLPGKTKKASSKPVTERKTKRSPPDTTASVDEQRSGFLCDYMERFIPGCEQVSDNVVRLTYKERKYLLTIKVDNDG